MPLLSELMNWFSKIKILHFPRFWQHKFKMTQSLKENYNFCQQYPIEFGSEEFEWLYTSMTFFDDLSKIKSIKRLQNIHHWRRFYEEYRHLDFKHKGLKSEKKLLWTTGNDQY